MFRTVRTGVHPVHTVALTCALSHSSGLGRNASCHFAFCFEARRIERKIAMNHIQPGTSGGASERNQRAVSRALVLPTPPLPLKRRIRTVTSLKHATERKTPADGVSRYVSTHKTQTSTQICVRRVNSFAHRRNGCEFLRDLLERKEETATTWPFRSTRFGNWLGLHEYWHR